MPWCQGCASRYRIEPRYRALGRLRRSGRRQSRTPPARDLKAGDTRREPQHSRGVPTHDIAEIVHAEVQSTEPDGDDQEGGTEHHGDLRAPAVDPEEREHVGEHAVPDERGHRVPARKAPAEVLEERGGTGRPRAKAASQPTSRIHSRRAESTKPTASAKIVSVTAEPRELIVLNTAYPVGVARACSQSSSATSNWVSGSWWMTSSVTPANTHSPARLITNPSVRCSPRYSPRAKRAVRVTRLVRFRSNQRHPSQSPATRATRRAAARLA